MRENSRFIQDQDQQPAIVADGRKAPDRRQISARWFAGTFLTGVTSCTLMGVALFAALDGREQLATPPQLLSRNELPSINSDDAEGAKSERLIQTLPRQNFDDRRQFDVSIMQKQDGKEVIKTQPFELIRMSLAEDRPHKYQYPKFNALNIFADDSQKQEIKSEDTLQIYATKVDPEVTLHNVEFPLNRVSFDGFDNITESRAENDIRSAGFGITGSYDKVAALKYSAPDQFGNFNSEFKFSEMPDVKIVQENVSVSSRTGSDDASEGYAEDIIPFRKKQTILSALNDANYEGEDVDRLAKALAQFNDSETLTPGSVLRIGIETKPSTKDHLIRASIYDGTHHILSIALNDQNQFIRSTEPEMTPVLKTAFDGGVPVIHANATNLPSIYDTIYRSVLSYDMPSKTAQQIIRIVASDIDLQERTSPTDTLNVFFASTDNDDKSNALPEIRYISATFGNITHKYYRYQFKNGTVDYFDSEGKNSKQFLLRKPVPNGIFRSPFGARRHPVLGYVRMHTGVDWAAPRGSPIVAAGDGVVTKIGVMSGYGNHTEIQHANGYMTSYSHQNAFAQGIRVGTKVRQGQIIGYVGSTGLSTGPHCHFEVVVNGTKVDPMRIRLPDNKILKGNDLEAFKRNRNSIDTLLSGQTDAKIATTNIMDNGS